MNRKVFIQVALPGLVIGAILLGACAISAWYIDRLQTNLSQVLSEDVISLEAAQELEIRVRQLRFHCFLYLIDPTPERLEPMKSDHQSFEKALALARSSISSPEEEELVKAIEDGYKRYHDELDDEQKKIAKGGKEWNISKVADKHPIRHVVDPCHELLKVNKISIEKTARESERVTGQAHLAMLLLGALGPIGGLVIGYAVARGLSRSIYRLSVRVQDISRHLDQKVASVSVAADGDLQGLDNQLKHIVRSVEEVAERLQQHQRDMLRAEQLSAVGQLAAGVAHEVRNPLAAMKMLVEAALRPNNTMPLSTQDLKVIYGEIARLEQRVQGFLDFARLPTPRRATCDLRDVLTQALDLIRTRARHQNVELVVSTPTEPMPGCLDREQVRTVFINLLLNALDAMPQGGRLEVELAADPHGAPQATIADSGSGISPEMTGRLFTPFASTKPTGTGLGLSISRRIVEEHGGTLTAENRPQGGACFVLKLPPSDSTPSATNGKVLAASSV